MEKGYGEESRVTPENCPDDVAGVASVAPSIQVLLGNFHLTLNYDSYISRAIGIYSLTEAPTSTS